MPRLEPGDEHTFGSRSLQWDYRIVEQNGLAKGNARRSDLLTILLKFTRITRKKPHRPSKMREERAVQRDIL